MQYQAEIQQQYQQPNTVTDNTVLLQILQYQAEIQQQYQQPNTVTGNTAQLQTHAIPRPRYTTVPAAEHSYRKYRTITNTCDTRPRYTTVPAANTVTGNTAQLQTHAIPRRDTNSTSSRIQLQEIPHNYKYMRYHGRDTQQYQQPNTVTGNTAQLQIHAIPRPEIHNSTSSRIQLQEIRTITNTCDTTAEIHNSTSSRIQLQEIPQNYKYMRYHGRDTQQYQQPNTVTGNTAQLQTHAIPRPRYTTVPAAEYSYRKYRTITNTCDTPARYTTVPAAEYSYRKYRRITNTCDTTAEIHNSTSSRIQLQEIPHNYKHMQ